MELYQNEILNNFLMHNKNNLYNANGICSIYYLNQGITKCEYGVSLNFHPYYSLPYWVDQKPILIMLPYATHLHHEIFGPY